MAVTRIKNRILIFAILATLIPSVGLGLLSFWQNETMIAENVTHQLRMLASNAGRELEFWLRERVDGLRTLSSSDAVIDGISQSSATSTDGAAKPPQALPHYLRLVQEKLDRQLELTVLDATGQVVASSADAPTLVSLPDSWPQNAATEGVIIDPPHWNETHASPTLTLAVPVLSLDNKILGALVAVVSLGGVQIRLGSASDSFTGDVVLLDLTGRPLLDTHAPVTELFQLDAIVVQRLRAQDGEPMTYRGHRHREVLGLAQIPRILPLIIVAEQDRDEIYQAWVLFRNLFLALLGGLTCLVALVGWRIGRSIVTPLERLTTAADHVAAGDLTLQVPVVRRDEIGHLTQVFNQMTDNLRTSHEAVEAANLTLQKQNQLLEKLSITDSLTGLFNRKKLDDILAEQLARYKRHHHRFAVLMLDIDHFKDLNDAYGHLAGDEALKNVAKILSRSVRNVDYVARYGGEEFVIVLPVTTTSIARDLAERICTQMRSSSCTFNGQTLVATLSIGVAGVRDGDETPDAVIERADHMLYEAKNAGRDRVHCAD